MRPRLLCTVAIAWAATLAGCNGASPGMHRATQLPGAVPPANADFDSIAVPPSTCVDGWQITLVPHQGSDPQWAIGPDGKMHIMFIGYGSDMTALRHVAEDTPETATTVSTMGLGSLAIAPDGTVNAFLAARSGTVQAPDAVGIVHVAKARGGWLLDSNEVSTDGGMINASAVDGDGHSHLAFGNGNLFYLTDVSGQWTRTAIGTQQQVAVWGLQLARDGHVHIWFSGTGADGITIGNYWATNSGGDWQVVPLPASDVTTSIDSKGTPHVVTNGAGSTLGLQHLWWDGSRWQTEAMTALGGVTAYDMRLDDNDKMHLLLETENSNIVYANNVGGRWAFDTVITFSTKGQVATARLGLGAHGQPHVAFKAHESGATFGFATHCK